MKIAIVKLSALGDIVHAMVVLQFIKKHLLDVTIDWVVEEGFKDILANNPDIHQIHTVNLKKAKQQRSFKLLFKELRKLRTLNKYDLVIDTQGLIKSAVVARVIPSAQTFGFDKASLRESFAAKFYSAARNIDYAENTIQRNAAVVASALNITISPDNILNKQPFLYFNSQISSTLISKTKSNIALIPGASFKSKIYPVEQYAQIAKELDANVVILWGNESEKLMADKIHQIAPQVHIAKRLTLDELKALISQMHLVIGGDTGPTHMAWALNIPSITLFGSTPGYRNTCTTNINKIIESDSTVDPYKINKDDFSIKDIKVSDVVKISRELLTTIKG
ncbi:MAG: lipopolysaccharide heptosyltransferase I [Gammaproteobacteria bacterium]|nr:lipopolysaccharide heptosyltransferase I [Gammaproteobacteria bacterium]